MLVSGRRYRSLLDILGNAAGQGDKPAVIVSNEKASRREIGYNDLTARCRKIAAGLSSLGIAKGKRVGALLPNGIEFIELWFATEFLGAVFVPFNTALKGSLLEYQMKDGGIEAFCYDQRLAANISKSADLDGMKLVAANPVREKSIPKEFHGSIDFETLLITGIRHRSLSKSASSILSPSSTLQVPRVHLKV